MALPPPFVKAGSTCAYKISQQDDRKRQRGIHGSSYDRSQHKGAGLHELVPAIGPDQLCPAVPAAASMDWMAGVWNTLPGPECPEPRRQTSREDGPPTGGTAKTTATRPINISAAMARMFPFQAVNPHPGKGTQEDSGQKCHQAG